MREEKVSNISTKNCAVAALQQALEVCNDKDVLTVQTLQQFFDQASSAKPMRVTDVWNDVCTQYPDAVSSFVSINNLLDEPLHPLQGYFANYFDCEKVPQSPFSESFKLIETAQIMHAPDQYNARSGHFVTNKSCSGNFHSPGCRSDSIWCMTFYILLPKDESSLGSQHCSKVYIHFSSPISPTGEGRFSDDRDTMDWGLESMGTGSSIGESIAGRKFFKGGQFYGQGSSQAPVGGMWASTKTSQTLLSSAFKYGGSAMTGLGIWKGIVDGYESKGAIGAFEGGVSGFTSWGCAVAAAGFVGLCLGTAALTIPGIVISTAAGVGASYLSDSYKLGSYVSDALCKGWDFACSMIGSGLSGGNGGGGDGGGGGGGGPGGVDLRRVPTLKYLHREAALLSTRTLHTFFPLNVDWNVVSELVNTRILPGLHIAAADIPSYLLHECLRMQHLHDAPLLFSLHFGSQGNSDLYSVMHPALRCTLIGYILGFTDYFLKSFLNGGTYSEAFLRNYAGNMSTAELQGAVIDLRLELKKARDRLGEDATTILPEEYVTIRDLFENDASDKDSSEKYHSAFRIIGDIACFDFDDNGVMQPQCNFFVESDLNMLPDRTAEVVNATIEGVEATKTHEDIVNAFDKMRTAIKDDMPRIPQFAPYFELLKVLTYCASLSRVLTDAGMMPPVHSILPALNIPSFPALMPPIPIRHIMTVNVDVGLVDWCEFAVTNVAFAGDMAKVEALAVSRLTTATVTQEHIQEATKSACKIARALIVARITSNSSTEPSLLNHFDDNELKAATLATYVTMKGISYLEVVLMLRIIEDIKRMFHALNEESEAESWVTRAYSTKLFRDKLTLVRNDFIPMWISRFETHKNEALASVKQSLEKQSRDAENDERTQLEDILTKIKNDGNEAIEKQRHDIHQQGQSAKAAQNAKIDNMIRGFPHNIYAVNQARQEIENDVNKQVYNHIVSMEADVNRKVTELVTKVKNDFSVIWANRQKKIEEIFIKESQRLDTLKDTCLSSIHSSCSIVEANVSHPIAYFASLSKEINGGLKSLCGSVVQKIRLPFLKIPETSDFHVGVVGGCSLGKSSVTINKTISVSLLHAEFVQSTSGAQTRPDGSKYFHWALPIEPSVSHGCWIKARYQQQVDTTAIRSIVYALQTVSTDLQLNDLLSVDSSGNTFAHTAVQSTLGQTYALVEGMPIEQCNVVRSDGFRPFDIACACGNTAMVNILLSKGVTANYILPNGLTPLLIACQGNHISTAMLILNTNAFGNVNHATDTKVSSLHWAVYYNSPVLVAELISKGALLLPRRSDSATALHIAIELGYNVCAELLIIHFKTALNSLITSDKRNILHHAAVGNNEDFVRMIDPSILSHLAAQKDLSGNTPSELALLHGYHNLAVSFAICETSQQRKNSEPNPSLFLSLNTALKDTSVVLQKGRQLSRSETLSLRQMFDMESSRLHQLAEHIVRDQSNPQSRKQYLLYSVESRNVDTLNLVVRHMTLTKEEETLLLRAVAEEGLAEWLRPLNEAGISIYQRFSDGSSVLDIAVSKCDLLFVKYAWKEILRGDLALELKLALVNHACVSAIRANAIIILQNVFNFRQVLLAEMAKMTKPGAARLNDSLIGGEVLCTADMTPRLLSVSKQIGVVFDEAAMVKAALYCRPSVIESLLAEPNGKLPTVRFKMLVAALSSNKMDAAYIIAAAMDVVSSSIVEQLKEAGHRAHGESLRLFSEKLKDLQDLLNKSFTLERLLHGDHTTVAALKLAPQTGLLPVVSGQCLAHFLVHHNLTEHLPSGTDLLVPDDTGIRAVDIMATVLVARTDAQSVAKLLFVHKVSLSQLLTKEYNQVVEKLESSHSAKKLILEYVSTYYNTLTVSDLAAAFRFLCNSCNCSSTDWVNILKLPAVDRMLPRVAFFRDPVDGTTVLMAAVCRPQARSLVTKLLNLSNAIDMLLIRDRFSKTAVHHCLECIGSSVKEKVPGMQTGIAIRATSLLSEMITKAPSLIYAADRDGRTPFMLAAKSDFVPCLAFLVSFAPVEVLDSACDCYGHRALHFAAKAGSCNAIKFLIRQTGLSPNAATEAFEDRDNDANGNESKANHANTPLHLAGVEGQVDAFRCLLDLGADPLRRNHLNVTAIHEAVEHGNDQMWTDVLQSLPQTWLLIWSGELLINAARNKKIGRAAMTDLLTAIHPNQATSTCLNDKSITPILAAASAGNWEAVALLIEEGADMTVTNSNRWNVLHFAALADDVSTVNVVLRFADVLLSEDSCCSLLSRVSITGDTPAHLAAKKGSKGVMTIFLGLSYVRNSILSMTNVDGLTPVDIAFATDEEMGLLLSHASSNYVDTISRSPEAVASASARLLKIPLQSKPLGQPVDVNCRDFPNTSIATRMTKTSVAINAFLESLSEKEKLMFNTHEAFATHVLVRNIFAIAGIDACKDIISFSRTAPAHVVVNFVHYLLIWTPTEDWDTVLRIMHSALHTYWKTCPDETHVIWQWLRMLMIPRTMGMIRPDKFYADLESFIVLCSGALLDELPSPGLCVKTLINPIEPIVKRLSDLAHDKQRILAEVRRLNTVPHISAQCNTNNRADILHGHWSLGNHWQVLEAEILHYGGAKCWEFLDDLRRIHLTPDERRFILSTALETLERPDSTHVLRSWGAVASLAVAEFGLQECRLLCDLIRKRVRSSKVYKEFLSILIQSFSAVCEIGDIQGVKQLLNSEEFRTSWFNRNLATLVMDSRNLGKDRDLDELVDCFSNSSSTVFQPHLFSFDGTPVVTLPAHQVQQLKNVILIAEQLQVDTCDQSSHQVQSDNTTPAISETTFEYSAENNHILDAKQIQSRTTAVASTFLENPSTHTLGELIRYVKEGFFQVTKKMPFRIQCMCVAAFFLPMLAENAQSNEGAKGRLGQVATGEGKSIIVAMTALLYGLLGKNVDVITSTQTLARRDADEFRELFNFFGVTVSTVAVNQPSHHDFNARVLYGTNTDFEFALLREGSECRQIRMMDPKGTGSWVTRVPDVAIVDESDNLFLDAACNSARMGHTTGSSFTWVYAPIFHLVRDTLSALGDLPKELITHLYPTAAVARAALSVVDGGAYQDKLARISDPQLQRWMKAAVTALFHRHRDTHYIVRQRKIVIVDLDTGRLQENSRWGAGVHEMVEAKEAVPIIPESGTIASISHPSFFEFYETVVAITGTAGELEERHEIREVYGVDTFDVPPHRPCLRIRLPTRIFRTVDEKFAQMVQSTKEMSKTRSVLVLVPDIRSSRIFSNKLTAAGVRNLLLNEEQQESEDLVIYKAGQIGSVTVATNTAGRGTDIKISNALVDAGGLHLIFGCFPINLRVECQGLGRSARQGQPGSNQIFVSLDEELVQTLVRKANISVPTVFTAEGGIGNAEEERVFIEKLYSARTAEILAISSRRCHTTSVEKVRFSTLKYFFQEQEHLAKRVLVAHNAACQMAYKKVTKTISLLPLQLLCGRLLEWYRISWTIFFTKIANDSDNLITEEEAQVLYKSSVANQQAVDRKAFQLYARFLEEARWPLTSISSIFPNLSEEARLEKVFQDHGPLASHMNLDQSAVLDELRG